MKSQDFTLINQDRFVFAGSDELVEFVAAAALGKAVPLIKADPVLLAQLIGNLLDNALAYSDGDVDLAPRSSPAQTPLPWSSPSWFL